MIVRVLVSLGIVLCTPSMRASDWPQWRGPERTGVSKETGLLKSWPSNGPPLVWSTSELGVGYSGPAIVGEKLYILGARGESEYLLAFEEKSGKEIWAVKIGPTFTFKGNEWGDGPRATPTVDGALIFAQGAQGILICADASGKELWRVDLLKDLEGEISPLGGNTWVTGWGFTTSPIVDGDQVVCVPGGKAGLLAALNKKNGKLVSRSFPPGGAPYSSPLVAEIDGVRQYLQITDQGAIGANAATGKLLWKYDKKPPYSDVVIPTPLCHDHFVYLTAGYGAGCDLVKLTKIDDFAFKAEKVYSNKNMVNQQGGVVLVGDYVYGYSEGKGWVCQDFKSGKLVWSEKRKLGRGSVICADGNLYCYAEDDGTLALVEASPKGWREKSRFTIPQKSKLAKPSGKVWTPPVIANGKLYLRDQELFFCFDIADHPSSGQSRTGK